MTGSPLFDPDDPDAYRLYDGRPPAEPASDAETSRQAADEIGPHVGRMQSAVLEHARRSPWGVTDDELELATGWRHQSVSARRRELVLLGLLADSSRRRPTRSGRMAVVWVAT